MTMRHLTTSFLLLNGEYVGGAVDSAIAIASVMEIGWDKGWLTVRPLGSEAFAVVVDALRHRNSQT